MSDETQASTHHFNFQLTHTTLKKT